MKNTRSKQFVATVSLGIAVFAVCIMAAPVASAQNLCTFDPTVAQGPVPPPPPQAIPPYFIWRPGNRGDQSTVAGQHSGLVGWNANIDDTTFAQETENAIVAGGVYLTVPLVYVFGECYGGGMIDDLAANVVMNPMSVVTASFFNQVAVYPAGNGTDFIWAYINAIPAKDVAQPLAAQAATDDPFGWAARPNPARNGEKIGTETPEYYSQVGGDMISIKRPANEVNNVILWSGQPEVVDDRQLSALIVKLLALGYSKDNIVVYFGLGFYSPANSTLVATMQANNFDPTHLRQADPADFVRVLGQWVFPANVGAPPQFMFFLANDHGCNNAFMAEEKSGNGGGAVPTGGPDPWGNNDGSMLPYPPRE